MKEVTFTVNFSEERKEDERYEIVNYVNGKAMESYRSCSREEATAKMVAMMMGFTPPVLKPLDL